MCSYEGWSNEGPMAGCPVINQASVGNSGGLAASEDAVNPSRDYVMVQ